MPRGTGSYDRTGAGGKAKKVRAGKTAVRKSSHKGSHIRRGRRP